MSSFAGFTLSSPDFAPDSLLPMLHAFDAFGCTGGNRSPALSWTGVPDNAKSLALLVHDPDAPTGGAGWWHWVVIDLPRTLTRLPQDAGRTDGANLPSGAVQIRTDFGVPGWGGPCPPVGDPPHHYHFTLHALDVEHLALPPDATASLAGFMIHAHSIASATLTGRFARP